jgi:hypothetical protein
MINFFFGKTNKSLTKSDVRVISGNDCIALVAAFVHTKHDQLKFLQYFSLQ